MDSCSALVKDIRAKGRGNQKTDKQHGLPPKMLPLEQEAGENLDTFPMIQVPKPNPYGGDPTMYVFRPWRADDVRRTVEGIPHPKVKAPELVAGINSLIESYRLNGLEVERAVIGYSEQIGV